MIACPACGTCPEENDLTEAWATCSCRRIIVDRSPDGAVLARTVPGSERGAIVVRAGVLYEFDRTSQSTVLPHCGRQIPCREVPEGRAGQRVFDYVAEVMASLVLES